jgi:hypothetical protein
MLAQPSSGNAVEDVLCAVSSCVVFIEFLQWGIESIISMQNVGLQLKLTEVQLQPNEAAVTVAHYIAFLRKCFAFTGDN